MYVCMRVCVCVCVRTGAGQLYLSVVKYKWESEDITRVLIQIQC